ncbi:His Kinase A (phospho-acceptor) domain-containing protein [Desulfatibacillum alkenivorans DSM 16219]|uniref:histidine kinase n=1 Tax=Desulfatibacillum alkenivorans DSM 16219 TaxID=1121393 RepID=A0A1M6XJD2_9BACT|nr:response regulator [Desulfatibacillum alkenivorans]SHL05969.1 His Kinase A (phospho-acceptor) domain-containing protein [Desulfatibacillum alkenivorans DSM 16219]
MSTEKAVKVLLVDDEDAFRQALAKRLERRRIEVFQAADGKSALEALKAFPVNVAVMDVKMPGMDGLETMACIKRDFPDTEVILLTGHAAVEDGIAGIRAGAFDYLQKPVETENLLNKIHQAYDKSRHQHDLAKEAELREALEKQMATAERLASLGTLAAGVAHEINNPLAIISEAAGYLQLLLKKDECREMPFHDRFEKAIEKIEKSVKRARRTTMQLLGFAGQPDAVYREIELDDLVEEVILLAAGQASAAGVTVAKEKNPSSVTLWTDPHRLRQVLINLVSNGIAACGRGGRVSLSFDSSNDWATIQVKDTGHGIPKENLERIFEPFFTTKPPGKGTGLGLFVSLDIVKRLGGDMQVKSKVGKGTIFQVSVPRLSKTCPGVCNDIDWRDKARELERRDNHGTGAH